jgi:hypothetical protein
MGGDNTHCLICQVEHMAVEESSLPLLHRYHRLRVAKVGPGHKFICAVYYVNCT